MTRLNRAKCRKCGDIIESKHRHDLVWCSCKTIAVDGGSSYCRRGGSMKDCIEIDDEGREIVMMEKDQ